MNYLAFLCKNQGLIYFIIMIKYIYENLVHYFSKHIKMAHLNMGYTIVRDVPVSIQFKYIFPNGFSQTTPKVMRYLKD